AEYIRKLPPEKYLEIATPWLEKALDPARFDFKRLAELLQGRTEVFSQLPDMVRFLKEQPEFPADFYVNKKQKSTLESAKAALDALKPILEGIGDWTEAELHDRVMEAIPGLGMKNGQVLWPMRIAISGQMSTPGGAFEIAYLLGRDETLRRLDQAIAKL
ncbi:MAG: glutamate--tRNA ligase, partial [Clostridia bacterium]|nr:glutamate--tRNA ligase [Clostridia bacterium]